MKASQNLRGVYDNDRSQTVTVKHVLFDKWAIDGDNTHIEAESATIVKWLHENGFKIRTAIVKRD